MIATALHHQSQRSGRPFMRINCAAIPSTLIESELFGYRKGAFTGAHNDRRGLIEATAGGTLLLDEIAEMPVYFRRSYCAFCRSEQCGGLATSGKYLLTSV